MAAVLEREPYTPRHRSDALLTGRQQAREEAARLRIRSSKPVIVRGRHGVYGDRNRSVVALRHPDDRLPLGLATATETRAA